MDILMHTNGRAAGHLSRVNAVYKGFLRAGNGDRFLLHAPRSKYLSYLQSGITVVAGKTLPRRVDMLICDWKSDDFIQGLPRDFASLWVGLRRMGRIPSEFPRHFHVVAIEPSVEGDITIWPILSTWRDELVSSQEFMEITRSRISDRVVLLCENGALETHPERVLLAAHDFEGMHVVKCSNSPHAAPYRDLDYWPVARLFAHAHHIVIGAGYNSVHECLCFSEPCRFTVIRVGGDDQESRLRHYEEWADLGPRDSRATALAVHLLALANP